MKNLKPLNMSQIHKSIVHVLRATKAVVKDRKADEANFQFRSIDDIANALHPLFQEAGIFITHEVLRADTETLRNSVRRTIVEVKYFFHAEDGSSVACLTKADATDEDGDKSLLMAMSYALKTVLSQMFLLPTAPPPKPVKAITALGVVDTRPMINSVQIETTLRRVAAGELSLAESVQKIFRVPNDFHAKLAIAIKEGQKAKQKPTTATTPPTTATSARPTTAAAPPPESEKPANQQSTGAKAS